MSDEKLKEPWRIDVTDLDHHDRTGRHAYVIFRSLQCGMGLEGCVAAAEADGRPVIKSIDRNDFLLSRRMAERLLRRIHHLYWRRVGEFGDVGIVTDIDLVPFLYTNFGEDARHMLMMLRRSIRTFCQSK